MKIVFMPGLDGTGDLFTPIVTALADEFQTITVRYPVNRILSYGQLQPIVAATIRTAEPFVLVAESFSTPLAIPLAAEPMPHLRGLILVAGFAVTPTKGWRRWMAFALAPMLARLPFPRFAVRTLLTGRAMNSLQLEAFDTAVSSVQPFVLAGRIREVLTCDVRASLKDVVVPILYLQATKDRLVPTSCLNEILSTKADISTVLVDGPHLLLQAEPDACATAISSFVRKVS